jgi:hypothetical protein
MRDKKNRLRFREFILIQVGSKLPTPRCHPSPPTIHSLTAVSYPH